MECHLKSHDPENVHPTPAKQLNYSYKDNSPFNNNYLRSSTPEFNVQYMSMFLFSSRFSHNWFAFVATIKHDTFKQQLLLSSPSSLESHVYFQVHVHQWSGFSNCAYISLCSYNQSFIGVSIFCFVLHHQVSCGLGPGVVNK